MNRKKHRTKIEREHDTNCTKCDETLHANDMSHAYAINMRKRSYMRLDHLQQVIQHIKIWPLHKLCKPSKPSKRLKLAETLESFDGFRFQPIREQRWS